MWSQARAIAPLGPYPLAPPLFVTYMASTKRKWKYAWLLKWATQADQRGNIFIIFVSHKHNLNFL